MGPIPISSTLSIFGSTLVEVGHFLGGLVAGEGSFIVSKAGTFADGTERRTFTFQLTMASRDRRLLEVLREFLGFGCINDRAPERAHWQARSTLTMRSVKAHRAAVIPFAQAYLPRESAKWRQFETWHERLNAWDQVHPALRVKGTCSEPGCDRPVRGRGVCRSHYYLLTGY